MTRITIYKHLLFCDFPATRFGLYRPSSEWSFSKDYSYKKKTFVKVCSEDLVRYAVRGLGSDAV